ncbi:MAG TPA: formate dehydrogenase accessory sulfurtransferase FdhD [Paracoccus sp. (in: a-proteobacteria)]|uniref:formate dehydrogenase accessory sulfurtransferase FdhD n=1 Tax=uncultured Paracoccus sp. TaxID=189685 RepID=UPI00261035B9|nr:formate dehydrogenase accessory sulfurtransferase FdhD [uncultured Paracoccus sp.]HMQ42230.1 formate dehydrogenase accessory sulfurtransferase FdhD [Paracoccus sp. (in: a-proteobacteria)]HMR35387.1 formate dehydrogenase accessory sulfurtransferase FdhD [Paracoccus sp. (in: a-proteobacteria)]
MSSIPAPARRISDGAEIEVTLAEETALAVTYDGSTQAVLMGTPADLEDFAYGFSLTEGIARPEEIDAVTPERVAQGVDLRIWLKPEAGQRFIARRRRTLGPVGCGLCGVETLSAAMRELGPVRGTCVLTAKDLDRAVAATDAGQALRDATGATHAAGFYVPGQGLIALREDVGRHNALDKLAGALIRGGHAGLIGAGAVILTSRVSVDLVQKVATLGAPVMVALAAPSSAAVAAAEQAGIGLAARARSASQGEIHANAARFAL